MLFFAIVFVWIRGTTTLASFALFFYHYLLIAPPKTLKKGNGGVGNTNKNKNKNKNKYNGACNLTLVDPVADGIEAVLEITTTTTTTTIIIILK